MKIFDVVNGKLNISEEAYLLRPFKKLWERDKTKDHELALAELGYIYFMEDFRSDFADILDEEQRSEEITIGLDFPKKWKPDESVQKAREFYAKWTETYSLKFVKDAKLALEQIRIYFRSVDIEEMDKMGKPKFDIIKLARTIEMSDGMLENLNKLEERVRRDLQAKSTARGAKDKNIFEDGI